ncbi:penicillin-binding protein activator [Sphingomonas sp.]|jgi:ABC-type branched-subunit amino acid transport system substrate-binding protein|uniref:penicillin-binding protein activator n=1 Tax=Sphingomonas sp. TaxID=28214 RepID=UPI002E30A423|nr:penicillin-binding protein activator [Sphingomonas sp.]HEX4693328.1 penicillin-binding protein activator [Sphingomonas sp.]
MAEAATKPQRKLLSRITVLALAVVVSACSTVVPRTAPPVYRPPAEAARPIEPVIMPGLPTDSEHHMVALLVPMTGPNGAVGRSIANATQLALLDTNNAELRITTYDTATGAAGAARKAIDEGAQLILGPLLSEDVRAVMPIARPAGVPVISFSNDISVAGDGAYLMGYSPAQSIERVVDYARDQGITTYGGLVANGLYGERASTAFLRAVEDDKGQVISLQTYDRNVASITAAARRLGKSGPVGAVLVVDDGAAAAGVVPLMRKAGEPGARVLGTERWNNESSIAAKPSLDGAWFASVPDNLYRQYAVKYRTRFGAAPYRLSSMGYDAVLLAIRIARDWPMGRPFPESRLRDRGGFAGIDGAFRFDRDGVAERALEVQEVRGGTTVTVSPAPSGF